MTTTTKRATEIKVVDAASRVARLKASKEEAAALKAWEQGGSKGRKPATPNLDAINAQPSQAGGKSAKPTLPKATFAVNGTPIPEGRGLAYIAFGSTGGCKRGVPRLSAADLRRVLRKAGIDDAEHTEWEHTLPNGVTITATI